MVAIGLAMDATAVSAARGLAVDRIRAFHVLVVMLAFGGSQALMPAIGWTLGEQFGPLIQAWDHWVAFALLAGIGAKTLWDTFASDTDNGEQSATHEEHPFAWRTIALLAVATSIDALAAGISLPVMQASFSLAISTIGIVTAVLAALGLWAGRFFGRALGPRLDVFGGLILIAIGSKILVEHLTAA